MQYRIRVLLESGLTRYVKDCRHNRPSYAAFEVASADECTVAPDIRLARQVRDAFLDFNAHYKEMGYGKATCTLEIVR